MDLGTQQVSHSFLVIPEYPVPLLGKDLLSKVDAQIHFHPREDIGYGWDRHPVHILSLSLENEYQLYQPDPSLPGCGPYRNLGFKNILWPVQKRQG